MNRDIKFLKGWIRDLHTETAALKSALIDAREQQRQRTTTAEQSTYLIGQLRSEQSMLRNALTEVVRRSEYLLKAALPITDHLRSQHELVASIKQIKKEFDL